MSKETYEKLYSDYKYRRFSPGEHLANRFLELAKPEKDDLCIDFGAGTGRAAKRISEACKVLAVDFASNALETDVEFLEHDLTKPLPVKAKYGFCTDVMEHIAPEDVKAVLFNIVKAAKYVFFQISTVPAHYDEHAGEQLHLTVQPFWWWAQQFQDLHCKIKFAQQDNSSVLFYVTAYVTAKDIGEIAVLNTSLETLKENVRQNLLCGYQEATPHQFNDMEVALLMGGPSLNDFKDEIYEKAKAGVPIITVNGTYKWCLDRGILPAMQIVLDARDFNKRFVEPVIPNCKYFICSQASPDLAAALPKEQTYLWHGNPTLVQEVMIDHFKDNPKTVFPVLGGSTVGLRSFALLIMLGYRNFSVYGFDSCLREGQHHAYEQVENDGMQEFTVTYAGKSFKCHAWMIHQAYEFVKLTGMIGQFCQMEIHGDGLIAHCINALGDYEDGSWELEGLQQSEAQPA